MLTGGETGKGKEEGRVGQVGGTPDADAVRRCMSPYYEYEVNLGQDLRWDVLYGVYTVQLPLKRNPA